MGDSTATSYTYPLRAIITSMPGCRLASYAYAGCRFTAIDVPNPDPEITRTCPGRKTAGAQAVSSLHPDLVFFTNLYTPVAVNGKQLSWPALKASDQSYLAPVAKAAHKVVLVATPPSDRTLAACYSPRTGPQACVSRVRDYWLDAAELAHEEAAAFDGISVDTRQLYCDDIGRCPPRRSVFSLILSCRPTGH